MRRLFMMILLVSTLLQAELRHVWSSPHFVNQGIKIIDIRTPAEWRETGVIKGSYTITFFDERGNFDVESFLRQLDMAIKPNEEFALVCRVGSRTGMVADFLSDKLGYRVVNLKGGIMKMIHEGYQTVPYR
jgi:rhodanese-related sulfurtransferase